MAILNAIPQSDEQVCADLLCDVTFLFIKNNLCDVTEFKKLKLNLFYFLSRCLVFIYKYIYTVYPMFVLQYDPFAEHRPQKIADREDEYKARRRQMIISPERLDPFADGKFCSFFFFVFITFSSFPPPCSWPP